MQNCPKALKHTRIGAQPQPVPIPSFGQRAQGSGLPPAHGAPLASAGHEFISRFICKTAFP